MTIQKWTDEGRWMPSVFDDMLENFFGNDYLMSDVDKVPAVNVKETKDSYQIEVAAPGMTKKDFKVHVDNGVLTISGVKKSEDKTEEDKYTRKEFSYSSFKRSFNLPDSVKHDDIGAEYKDGILHIQVPKKEEAKKASAHEVKIK